MISHDTHCQSPPACSASRSTCDEIVVNPRCRALARRAPVSGAGVLYAHRPNNPTALLGRCAATDRRRRARRRPLSPPAAHFAGWSRPVTADPPVAWAGEFNVFGVLRTHTHARARARERTHTYARTCMHARTHYGPTAPPPPPPTHTNTNNRPPAPPPHTHPTGLWRTRWRPS